MGYMDIANELKDIANLLEQEKENQIHQKLRNSHIDNLRLDNICQYANITCKAVKARTAMPKAGSHWQQQQVNMGQYRKQKTQFTRGGALNLSSDSVCTWIPKIACSTIRYSIAIDNGVISARRFFMDPSEQHNFCRQQQRTSTLTMHL